MRGAAAGLWPQPLGLVLCTLLRSASAYERCISILTVMALHPHQSAAYFRTLGFLARHGELHAEVPPKFRDTFEEKYQNMAGYWPVLHEDKYFPIDVMTDYDKWGPELRIYFPDRDDVEFPLAVELRSGVASGTLRINNNHYWWQLVQVGFRLGTEHDVKKIRASVPAGFRTDFDKGLRS